MFQISKQDGSQARLAERVKSAVQWWAEHQAWPAQDAIRIEDFKRR